MVSSPFLTIEKHREISTAWTLVIAASRLAFDSRNAMRHAVIPDLPQQGERGLRMSKGLVEC
jgi:hypothetical protein